ncbi:MAG: oligosaccharide flippase family protein [Cyanobacteria bacterium P01_F01_bin.150]
MSTSLKKRAIASTAWTLFGYGGSQFIRLAANLVITRLIAKELFGIMALVNVLMIGLNMFSDVGIGPSIIQDEKGNDPRFLNTAWTIQVFRGFALWFCACLIAYPFALFYDDIRLVKVIPVLSLVSVINGFASTSIFTKNKELNLAKLTLLDMIPQVLSIIFLITWSYFSPTIWALVFSTLIGALIKVIMSHFWLGGIRNRFAWDPAMARRLVRFGRWVFVSTVIAFGLNHMDRLIFGKFMSLDDLAVYSIAAMFATVIDQTYRRLGSKVLFPLYAKIKGEPLPELRRQVRKIRIRLMGVLLPGLSLLIILGPYIIDLYPEGYGDAAWMLQLLAVGWIVPMATFLGPIFLAFGDSFLNMKVEATRASILIGSMIVGGLMYDVAGLIWGIAIADAIFYPFLVIAYRRYSLWFPMLDFVGIAGSLVAIGIGLYFTGGLQFGFG